MVADWRAGFSKVDEISCGNAGNRSNELGIQKQEGQYFRNGESASVKHWTPSLLQQVSGRIYVLYFLNIEVVCQVTPISCFVGFGNSQFSFLSLRLVGAGPISSFQLSIKAATLMINHNAGCKCIMQLC